MRFSVRLWLDIEGVAGIPCRVELPDHNVIGESGVDLQGLTVGQGNGQQIAGLQGETGAGHGQERVRVYRMGEPRRAQAVTLPALAPWALMNTSADAPSHRVQA